MERLPIFGLTKAELEAFVTQLGMPRFRAGQVYDWMYRSRVHAFPGMRNISQEHRSLLERHAVIELPVIHHEQRSVDGTRKFLLRLRDGNAVEAVLIPPTKADPDSEPEGGSGSRLTLCMSTQVGCALACEFCATATLRLRRNLTPGEILGQYHALQAVAGARITNLVLMGMGEPLLNYDAVVRALDIIGNERNEGVAAPRITISTAGVVPGIERMAHDGRREKLALSLHATTDELRSRLIPLNRRWPLAAVREALERYHRATRRTVTFEYILFAGLNDTVEDVRRLVKLTRSLPSKINIIPFHAIPPTLTGGEARSLVPASPATMEWFAGMLRAGGVTVMRRASAGQDIDAACGQLAGKLDV